MGDLGLISGLGRSPGEGKDYLLQYSGLENSMDYLVHGVLFLISSLVPLCTESILQMISILLTVSCFMSLKVMCLGQCPCELERNIQLTLE